MTSRPIEPDAPDPLDWQAATAKAATLAEALPW